MSTLDEILDAVKLLEGAQNKPYPLGHTFGVPVFEDPHIPGKEPKLKISDKIDLRPEARARLQKYLTDTFGETEPVVFRTQFGLFMHPTTKIALMDYTGA